MKQTKKLEFYARFGVINERRHQLHEVIRLSGMNLIVNDYDHPLIIKVASIPQIRIQVYFIDNEEFFKKKFLFKDAKGKYFKDNDERSMFFCRGVLETVKKLGWMPDIVHCHGWMTALMPVYLKSIYANDPHFSDAKVIYSVYNRDEKLKFSNSLDAKLEFDEIPISKIDIDGSIGVSKLHEIAVHWSDAIGICSPVIDNSLMEVIKASKKPLLEHHEEEQTHPVTDRILHLDFLEVSDSKPFKLNLPVRLEGFSKGVRNGGNLSQNFRKLKVMGLLKDIPDAVKIDITPLTIGDKIRVSDLNISGLKFFDPENAVIVGVQMARAVVLEEEEEEEDETTEEAEGTEESSEEEKPSEEPKKDE